MDQEITALETVPHELLLQREPDKEIENATIAAKALKKVIDGRDDKVVIRGKTFLRYEDWQTVGQFYGYSVQTDEAAAVEIDGIKGAKAKAILLDRNGNLAGGAEAYCMRDEEKWATSPWFQLASMAQTRAGAKALRNRLAWVAVLAGYSGTPAEEMDGNGHSGPLNESRFDVPSCPECGSQMWDNRATKRGRQPDFKCKDKTCAKAIWLDNAKTDEALRGELFGQAQKLLAHKDVSIRTAALDRLAKMPTEEMTKAVTELAENMRAKIDPAEQERLAKIKTIETNVPAKEIERELRESHEGKTLYDLTLDQLIDFQDNCVPF